MPRLLPQTELAWPSGPQSQDRPARSPSHSPRAGLERGSFTSQASSPTPNTICSFVLSLQGIMEPVTDGGSVRAGVCE